MVRVKKAVNNKHQKSGIRMLTDDLNTKTSDFGDMRRLWATETESTTTTETLNELFPSKHLSYIQIMHGMWLFIA